MWIWNTTLKYEFRRENKVIVRLFWVKHFQQFEINCTAIPLLYNIVPSRTEALNLLQQKPVFCVVGRHVTTVST